MEEDRGRILLLEQICRRHRRRGFSVCRRRPPLLSLTIVWLLLNLCRQLPKHQRAASIAFACWYSWSACFSFAMLTIILSYALLYHYYGAAGPIELGREVDKETEMSRLPWPRQLSRKMLWWIRVQLGDSHPRERTAPLSYCLFGGIKAHAEYMLLNGRRRCTATQQEAGTSYNKEGIRPFARQEACLCILLHSVLDGHIHCSWATARWPGLATKRSRWDGRMAE